MTLQFDPLRTPPQEIIDAAFLLGKWAAENNLEYWQIGPVCDRKFAYENETLEKVAEMLERQHTWITNVAAANLVRNMKGKK